MRTMPPIKSIGLNALFRTPLRPSKTPNYSDRRKLGRVIDYIVGSSEEGVKYSSVIASRLDLFPHDKQRIMGLKNPVLHAKEYNKDYVKVQLGQYENGEFSKIFPISFFLSKNIERLTSEAKALGSNSTLIVDGKIICSGGKA